MPSTPTARNRLEKQATGENLNVWGSNLNTKTTDMIDEALDGVEAITISSSSTTLTSTNYASDQARNRVLVLAGTLTGNSDIIVPGVEKWYVVVDNTTRAGFSLTMKCSAQTGYALRPGPQVVYCDATDVRRGSARLDQLPLPAAAVDMNAQRLSNLGAPAAAADAATRQYVDSTAFDANAGILPGQSGNSGKFLTTDGSVASWDAPLPDQTGNAGEFLTTDGSTASWQLPIPAQSGNSGKYLRTNGSASSWDVIDDATFIRYVERSPARANTGSALSLPATSNVHRYTLNSNCMITLPTAPTAASEAVFSITVSLVQDGTGSRSVTWAGAGSDTIKWDAASSAPPLNSSANKETVFSFMKMQGETYWRGAKMWQEV